MALVVYNPKHPKASSGWVAVSETDPYPRDSMVWRLRDAGADATANPYTSTEVDLRTRKLRTKECTYALTAGTGTISTGNIAAAFAFDGSSQFVPQGTDNAAYTRAVPRVTAGAVANTNLIGYFRGIAAQRVRWTTINAALGTGTFDLYITLHVEPTT